MKISHRIFLLIIVTTLLSTLTNYLLTRYQGKTLYAESEQLLAQTIVRALRAAVVQEVIDGNKLRVANLLASIKEQDNPIEFLYVTGDQHEIFAHSYPKGFPRFLIHQKHPSLDSPGIHLTHKYQTKQGLIFEYSEVLIQGLDATLHIGINQTHINNIFLKNTQYVLLISVGIVLLILLFVFVWSKRITQPLSELAKQIQRFGSGESVSFSQLEKSAPEIRQLAYAFQVAISERQQAVSKLQDREQNLSVTLNSIGDAVITTDAKGMVARMNPVAEKLTGWSLQEAKGQPMKVIFSVIDASTRQPIANPVDKVLATGETVYLSNHTTLISKDGTEFHIADSAAPIRNGDDHILGMVLVFNDVSDQYRLREKIKANQRLTQGLMDDLKSMVGIMQPDGKIAFINNMPLKLAEVYREQVIGQFLSDCPWFRSNNESRQQLKKLCQRVALGETVNIDIQFQTKEHLVWMDLGIYPILDDDGQVIQMVFEGVDISQRKETEELQKNYQAQLELQVYERTSELEKKAVELQRADQLKSEFLANMSHELRTPMNSIIGFTGRVLKKAAVNLDARQLKNLRTVERNAHHLLGLINGLLDLSKIEAGKMEAHAELFDFSTLAQEVFTITQSMLDDKPLKLIVDLSDDDIQLKTDIVKLKQVLINLVSNAIKFTQEGSITITAKLLNDSIEPQIAIGVIDTGVGMNKEALQYIFDAFRQVDAALTRKVGGTGLGLAIVQSFTKLLRGKVNVESEEGKGTSFEIVIPVNLNATDTSSETYHQPFASPLNLNKGESMVLCIDDEADSLDLLRGYLHDEGYQVITAMTGEEGFAMAKQHRPLVITLDILMPHKDGWSVLNELKGDPATRDIPVIIITFMDNKALGFQLGAFDYMQKPVEPLRLTASIQRLSQNNFSHALVIDDDPEARDLICQILHDTNIQCCTAVDGNGGISHLKQSDKQLPDLILLDLMMPGMDGFEMLTEIQKVPTWAAIPVIIVTAKTLEEHEREFLRPKVESILAKDGLTSHLVLKQLGRSIKSFKGKDLERSET